MRDSSAKIVSYDLRPAKQSERRILIDILKLGGDCGLMIHNYRYVGMGANRFYDFLLMHKYLGISKMVSLEHDAKMFGRAKFNVPYQFISVQNVSVSEFISADRTKKPSVYWLDYDGGIDRSITDDIMALSTRIKVGDFCFVTVYGGAPGIIDSCNSEDRLLWLQENLDPFSNSVETEDVSRSRFRHAVHKILVAAFKNAYAPRSDGAFLPILQVEYTDSVPMVTVGGVFLDPTRGRSFSRRVNGVMPFLTRSDGDGSLYRIKSLNLTERERAVFDRAVSTRRAKTAERKLLDRLGFTDQDLKSYGDLIRYLPRYVETMI